MEKTNELLENLPHGGASKIQRATGLSRTIVDRVLKSYPDRGSVKIENFEAVVSAANTLIIETKDRERKVINKTKKLTHA